MYKLIKNIFVIASSLLKIARAKVAQYSKKPKEVDEGDEIEVKTEVVPERMTIDEFRNSMAFAIASNHIQFFTCYYTPDFSSQESIDISNRALVSFVEFIKNAKKSLKFTLKSPDVFLFNEEEIVEELQKAKDRGVHVDFIFYETKSELGEFGLLYSFLKKNNIPLRRTGLFFLKDTMDEVSRKRIYNKETIISDERHFFVEFHDDSSSSLMNHGFYSYGLYLNENIVAKEFSQNFEEFKRMGEEGSRGDEWKGYT
jgi:hypothetical protein